MRRQHREIAANRTSTSARPGAGRASWRTGVTMAALLTVTAGCATHVAGVSASGPTALSTNTAVPTESVSSAAVPTAAVPSTRAYTTDSTPTGTSGTINTDPSSTDPSSTGSSGPSTPANTDTPPSSSSSSAPDKSLYPTAPIDYNVTPNTIGIATLMEGRRLAGYSLDPGQIESNLTHGVVIPTFPLRSPDALSSLFGGATAEVAAKRDGMYAGYSAARSDPGSKAAMVIAAFVFPTSAAAQKAAKDLNAAVKSTGDSPVKFSGLPGAVGWQAAAGTTEYYAHGFLASGTVVAYVWVTDGISKKATLPGRLVTALKAQAAALAGYKPIAAANLMTQKYDPAGLYSRTLPPGKATGTVNNGLFSLQGALHTQQSYVDSKKTLTAAGVDLVSIGRSVLYRARDAAGAALIRDQFYAQEVAGNSRYRDYQPQTSKGRARCLEDTTAASYICFGTAGRVAIEYSAQSEDDLTKSVDAQVALLGQ